MLDLTHSLEQVIETGISTVTLTKQQLRLRLEECELVQFDPMVEHIHSENIVHKSRIIILVKLLSDTKEPHELLVGLILEARVGYSCSLSIFCILSIINMHFLIEFLVYLIHVLVTCASSGILFICRSSKPGLDALSMCEILFLRAAFVSASLWIDLRGIMFARTPRPQSRRRRFDLNKVFSRSFCFRSISLIILNIHVIC